MTVVPVEADEDYVNDFVQDYSDAKRLAPSRSQELAEKALSTEQPAPPDEDVSYPVWGVEHGGAGLAHDPAPQKLRAT